MSQDASAAELNEQTALEPTPVTAAPAAGHTEQIARTAGLISLGNITGRVLGLAVITVKALFFGVGGAVDAFNVASTIPTMLYDLLIGGMINSSLVPVFIEYVQDRREELWRLVSILLSLTVVGLAGVML